MAEHIIASQLKTTVIGHKDKIKENAIFSTMVR